MNCGFGVDVGGTTVKIGFFDTEGNLLHKWAVPTNISGNGAHILPEIADSLKSYMSDNGIKKTDIIGVGMGVPGPVGDDGTVHKCVNLGWGVFNVKETLERLTGLRVKATNDANAAALGEMWKGGGKGYDKLVMVTLGTGVGGGIVLDGKALNGAHGAAGEIGHMPVRRRENRICGCGKRNCLETYASGSGIAKTARERISAYADSSLNAVPEITAKDIFEHAARGDRLAKELIEELGSDLGEALASIACVCDPEIFVLGGGVSHGGLLLLDVVQKHFFEYAFHACRETKFALAKLGGDAGIYGAMRLLL
ncbi:MAG TPA: ROK family glucokinase [Clostridiales bacterium]|nr:ROK family glucokinase [Clostridiales bacterium]